MLRYLLDTKIPIIAIKNRPEGVRQKFGAHDGDICASSVTAMELLYGAQRSQAVRRDPDATEGLLARLDNVDCDLGAADHAGQIRAEPAAAGRPTGPFEVMSAGHARSRGLCLVTDNERAFGSSAGFASRIGRRDTSP